MTTTRATTTKVRAYAWTAPGGDRLRLITDPVPRLQIEAVGGDWDDVQPTKYPRSLFAKLAELVGAAEAQADDDTSDGLFAWSSELLDECFEITEVEL